MSNVTSGEADATAVENSPFGSLKTSEQFTQLSIDPSFGLTRKRYGWYSNGTLFDDTLFSAVEAGIRMETTATGTDEARIRSAYPGQYISQALAQPGIGMVPDADIINIDSDGRASLTHGELYAGAFYWDSATDSVSTGIGFKWDSTGWEFFVRSNGSHIGPSPIPQSEFGFNSGDGQGQGGRTVDPSNGYVYNFPYTWYNEGPLGGAFLNPYTNRVEDMVRAVVEGRPSTDTANLPPQVVLRNAGTATSMGVEVGGMQFSTYGAGRDELERRPTDETREMADGYISNQQATSQNAVDPSSEPGVPLMAVQRESGFDSLVVRGTRIFAVASSDDVWVFTWDEYDPATALTGESFTDPVSPNNEGKETHLKTDTQATDYTPTTGVFRGMSYFEAGQGNSILVTDTDIDERIPLDATRVYTAVNVSGTNAELNPFKLRLEEGY